MAPDRAELRNVREVDAAAADGRHREDRGDVRQGGPDRLRTEDGAGQAQDDRGPVPVMEDRHENRPDQGSVEDAAASEAAASSDEDGTDETTKDVADAFDSRPA